MAFANNQHDLNVTSSLLISNPFLCFNFLKTNYRNTHGFLSWLFTLYLKFLFDILLNSALNLIMKWIDRFPITAHEANKILRCFRSSGFDFFRPTWVKLTVTRSTYSTKDSANSALTQLLRVFTDVQTAVNILQCTSYSLSRENTAIRNSYDNKGQCKISKSETLACLLCWGFFVHTL